MEYRCSGGIRLRAYGGLGTTLAAADCRGSDDGGDAASCSGEGTDAFYGGLVLGYGF